MIRTRKARRATLDAAQRIVLVDNADRLAREAVRELRRAGAHKAADAVARARKSIGGAIRHAFRVEHETDGYGRGLSRRNSAGEIESPAWMGVAS